MTKSRRSPPPEKIKISRRDMMFIAAESRCDLRTVSRAYAGETLKTLTRERIAAAAGKLNLAAPPEAKIGSGETK